MVFAGFATWCALDVEGCFEVVVLDVEGSLMGEGLRDERSLALFDEEL